MDTQLLTQSGLDEVGLHLDNLGADLSAHADGSLSSHGINALHFTGTPVNDAYGNDISVYHDSAGNVVGDYFVRFTVDGTIYYAPARKNATLAAQPPVAINMASSASDEALNGRGSTALATQFGSAVVDDLAYLRSGLLEPHSRLGHWEAHQPVRVLPRSVLNSAGDTVGRNTLVWQFRGVKFEIPCDPRLGGPAQKPRGATVVPNDINVSYGSDEGYNDIAKIAITCTAQGTQPFSFIWEIQVSANGWTALTHADGSSTGEITGADNRLKIAGSANNSPGQSIFTISALDTSEGSNNGYIRCAVTNSAGTVWAVVPVKASDKTSCIVFTSSCEAGYCDSRYLLEAVKFRLRNHKNWLATQEWGGYLVLGRPLGKLVLQQRWYSRLIVRAFVEPLYRGMTSVNRGQCVPFGIGLCCTLIRGACLAAYCLFRSRARAAIESLAGLNLMELYRHKLRRFKK